jgi:hypothetical protein
MHGPSVAIPGRGRRKTYRIAFLDDATRVIPYCAFALSENTQAFLPRVSELAHCLSSEITHLPTCAVAEFTFDSKSWKRIGKDRPATVALEYPKGS